MTWILDTIMNVGAVEQNEFGGYLNSLTHPSLLSEIVPNFRSFNNDVVKI